MFGLVCETYPAGSLRGGASRTPVTNARPNRDALDRLAGLVLEQYTRSGSTAAATEQCRDDDDALDAFLCALTARAVAVGATHVPSQDQPAQARRKVGFTSRAGPFRRCSTAEPVVSWWRPPGREAVRTKHLDDDDLLEPLPVDDGPPAHVVMVEAVRETIAEVPALRQAAPWSYDAQRQALTVPTTSYLAAFSRMIALHPTQLEHLGEWFETNAVDARMRIVRRLTLGRPGSTRRERGACPASYGARGGRGRSRSSSCCGPGSMRGPG